VGFFKKLLAPPGLPLLPSFKEASAPDATWSVAGLKFGAHTDGLPFGMVNYITVQHEKGSVSAVPEPGTAAMLAVGMVICVLLAFRRKGR